MPPVRAPYKRSTSPSPVLGALTWATVNRRDRPIASPLPRGLVGCSFLTMPRDLRRYQESGQSHFVTFSCYRRRPFFNHPTRFQLFVLCLEEMRRRFDLCVYAYVVMPEHVHLLLSEPETCLLADAIHFLKLSFTKRSRSLPMGEPGTSGKSDTTTAM